MKQIILVLTILLCQEAFAWNAERQRHSPNFNRDTLRKASGTRERQHSALREFLRNKGSLTQEEDDLLFLELSTLMKHENDHVSARGRRSEGATTDSGMTSEEKQEALDVHNAMRRLEPAANMQRLTWNDELAILAQEWATGCRWGHGQPDNDFDYGSPGQNLYFIQGLTALNVTWSIIRWFNERPYYVYENITCLKSPCGHYTQLVWGDSREMGCGFQMCDELVDIETGKVWKNAHHFVCNYYPSGNIPGQKPYIEGEACTSCKNDGVYWCDDEEPRGLCIRNCTDNDVECVCGAGCLNGGNPTDECTCRCADGWVGDRCEKECKDYSSHCGVSPGYPKYTCVDKVYGPEVRELCPKLCDQCNVSTATTQVIMTTPEMNTTTLSTPTTTSTISTTQTSSADIATSIATEILTAEETSTVQSKQTSQSVSGDTSGTSTVATSVSSGGEDRNNTVGEPLADHTADVSTETTVGTTHRSTEQTTDGNTSTSTTRTPEGESDGIWWPIFPIFAIVLLLVLLAGGIIFLLRHNRGTPSKENAGDIGSINSNDTLLKLQELEQAKNRQSYT